MHSVAFDFTLEPLRAHGIDSLNVRDVPGIDRITLREVQFSWANACHETMTRQADDIFRCVELESDSEGVFPPDSIPRHAFFDVRFTGASEPRSVLLCAPNTIKLEQDSDAPSIHRWLVARGFAQPRTGEETLSA